MPMSLTRGIARRFIPEMLQNGWTSAYALGYLKGQGLGYRRKDFLADFREFSGREKKRDPLKAIPKKYKPTWETIEMSEYKQDAKLHYMYKVEGYDTFTGKQAEEWITVATDEVLTMKEAEAEAKRLLEKYKSELVIEKLNIDAVTSNIGQVK